MVKAFAVSPKVVPANVLEDPRDAHCQGQGPPDEPRGHAAGTSGRNDDASPRTAQGTGADPSGAPDSPGRCRITAGPDLEGRAFPRTDHHPGGNCNSVRVGRSRAAHA